MGSGKYGISILVFLTLTACHGPTAFHNSTVGLSTGISSTPPTTTPPATDDTAPPVEAKITHGSQLMPTDVGPAAIGITTLTSGVGASIYDDSFPSYVKEVAGTATYDGFVVEGPHLLIQGVDISGALDVYADKPVVIRGCRVRNGTYWNVHFRYGDQPAYVLFSTIGQGAATAGDAPIGIKSETRPFIAYRNDISYVSDGIDFGGSNVSLIENYVHDLTGAAHHDGISDDAGESNISILRNKILNPMDETSAIFITASPGKDINNWNVDSNYFAGGGYSCYCGASDVNKVTNLKITNNIFGLDFYPQGGYWGAVVGVPEVTTANGNVWSGNKLSNGQTL